MEHLFAALADPIALARPTTTLAIAIAIEFEWLLARKEPACTAIATVALASAVIREMKGLAGGRQRGVFDRPKMHHYTLFEWIKVDGNVL